MSVLKTLVVISLSFSVLSAQKVPILALGIPLADHYAGIVAYERYKNKMKHADYKLLILPGPDLVRRYFRSYKEADVAFNVAPMVMDMYAKKPDFRWISLIHRDGNALVINKALDKKVHLDADKSKRIPDGQLAQALSDIKKETGKPVEIAVPSLMATHTTVLYKYLKDNNKTAALNSTDKDASLFIVKPPKSIAYLKAQTVRSTPSGFEQSLPWADVAETQDHGSIAWYSKDVMKHKGGHVECIIIAKDETISKKREALKEVIYYIHKAGLDIESARAKGGKELDDIINMIRKHIPMHTKDAIKQSLRTDIMAINYINLNVDENSKESFKKIMDLAFEAGFIKEKVDIATLSSNAFSTQITVHNN